LVLAAVLIAQTVAGAAVIAVLPAYSVEPGRPPAAATDSIAPPRIIRSVNLGGARTAALLDRVRADFDGAAEAVERFWGSDWTPEIVVVATNSPAQFVAEAQLDPRRQWSDIAAVAVADEVDLANRRAVGQRIVLAPDASTMSDQSLRIVLTHELFHLAARTETAPDAPRWLTEGVADFVARPTEPLPPGAAANATLPTDADLEGSGPDRSAGYDRAWWFARFVADTFGVDRLRLLYSLACGPGHGDFGWAVREALDVDVTELRARWQQWLDR
jgi:hypothetical protein